MSWTQSKAGCATRPRAGCRRSTTRSFSKNDLEQAAVSLRPRIADALDVLREAGAEAAFVTGSGPTAVGLFGDIVAADRAFGELGPEWADAIVTASVVRP